MESNQKRNRASTHAIDVSATTGLDLKAELFKATEQFEREKRSSSTSHIPARRPLKKPKTLWEQQNRGVSQRNAQDAYLQEESRVDLEKSRQALERKAALYEKLRRGDVDSELSEQTAEALLVDFKRKQWDEETCRPEHSVSGDSESEMQQTGNLYQDEMPSRVAEQQDSDPDAWIEYTDEFGRSRTIRRRDLPDRSMTSDHEDADPQEGPALISADMLREKERQHWEDETQHSIKAPVHYDASREVRTKGVGFYQLAQEEDLREQQLRDLERLRQETESKRATHQHIRDKRQQQLAKRTELLQRRRAQLQRKLKQDDETSIDSSTAHAISDLLASLRPHSQ